LLLRELRGGALNLLRKLFAAPRNAHERVGLVAGLGIHGVALVLTPYSTYVYVRHILALSERLGERILALLTVPVFALVAYFFTAIAASLPIFLVYGIYATHFRKR
jgi:hypothetical protein